MVLSDVAVVLLSERKMSHYHTADSDDIECAYVGNFAKSRGVRGESGSGDTPTILEHFSGVYKMLSSLVRQTLDIQVKLKHSFGYVCD